MGLGHSHDHSHTPPASATGPDREEHRRALKLALALTGSFTVIELVGGLLTGSLALLADAVHMLSDNLSLALALVAISLASRPPTPQRSFGWQRAEILAALANGIALLAVSAWILWEAGHRLGSPQEIEGAGVLIVAVAGAVVNLLAFRILSPGSDSSLNIEGAVKHVLADLAGSVGVIVAAVIVLTTGWEQADAVVAGLIAILIVLSAIPLIRGAGRILLEQTPEGLDAEQVGRSIASIDGVRGVHDLHIWTITSGFPAMSAHVLVGAGVDCHLKRLEVEALLRDRYALSHTTLQMEHEVPEGPIQLTRD